MSGKYHRLSKGKDEKGKRIFIDEHRFIMEQHIGRKLKNDEIVHHIDGNKSNNKIENLKIKSSKEHKKIHLKDNLFSEESIKKRNKRLKHRSIYSRRKINDEKLISMINDYKNGMKLREIDRKYNLSNGTFGTIIRGKIYYDKKELINSILNN